VAHVLSVPALQVGDPVPPLVLVEADDLPLQGASRGVDRAWSRPRDITYPNGTPPMPPSLTAFAFGFTLAIAVGPIALLIVNLSATGGLRVGAASGLGAALADLTYALATFLGGSALAPWIAAHAGPLRGVAAGVLVLLGLWMAAGALRGLKGPAGPAGTEARPLPLRRPLLTTFLLTAVNPLTLLLFSGFALQLPLATSPARAVGYALCLFLGSLVVQQALALGGATLGRFLTRPAWLLALNLASGLGICLFGVAGLVRGAGGG
jgi:threonine/homoserine/homoserine lactone efflux protein